MLPILLWIKLPHQDRGWGLLVLIPLLCYQSLWFYSPMNTPYLILIYALFITRSYPLEQLNIPSKISSTVAVLAILLATVYRTYVAFFFTYEDHLFKHRFNVPDITCDSLVMAQGPGQMHLSQYLYFLPETIKVKQHDKKFIKQSLKEAICACNAIKRPTLTFLIAQAYFYKYLLSEVKIPFYPEQKKQLELLWKQKILESLKIAPLRTDISSPYLIYMLRQKYFTATREMIDCLHAKDRDDPVALWFEGMLLIKSKNDKKMGEDLLRQALAKNIQRLLPVSTKLVNSLNITSE